jgi:hypothetical protein
MRTVSHSFAIDAKAWVTECQAQHESRIVLELF